MTDKTDIVTPDYEFYQDSGIVFDHVEDQWYSCYRGDGPVSDWRRANRLDATGYLLYCGMGIRYMIKNTILPERFRGGVERYVEHGIEPGHFIQAMLESNLVTTYYRADDISREQIPIILQYFMSEIPGTCWGDADVVRRWIEKGGRAGITS